MTHQQPEQYTTNTYTTILDTLSEYNAFCLAADCLVTLQYRGQPAKQYPAQIVDRDEDGKIYVKTHPRSEVKIVPPAMIAALDAVQPVEV